MHSSLASLLHPSQKAQRPPIPIPTTQLIPQVLTSAQNAAGSGELSIPNPTAPVDAPLLPSVHAPPIELLQAGTPALYAPIPAAPVDRSSTTTTGASPVCIQSLSNESLLNATSPMYAPQSHARPPAHTHDPGDIAPVAHLDTHDIPSNLPGVDTSSDSIPTTGAGGGSVSFLDATGASGVRDSNSGAPVNSSANLRGWENIGTGDALPNFSGGAFGGYTYAMNQGPSNGGGRCQMTMLLGNDYVFNDISLPSNQNHPGLSFDSVYNSFEAIPTADSTPDNASGIPKPSVPIKRSSDVDNDNRPTKKSAKKQNDQHAAKASGKSKATTLKDPFIMFTPGTSSESSSQRLYPTTTPATAEGKGSSNKKASGRQRASGKKNDNDDDDDNEEQLAEAAKALAKARLELLPQEIPPFKLYVEPANPLDFSSTKHHSVDLPVSYLLPKNLPMKVKNRPCMWFGIKKGKFEMVSDEWDEYLKNGTPISARSKNLITKYASICPRALTYSREVALYILTTDHGNIICPYHRWLSKKIENDVQFETHKPNHYFVTGVPGVSRVKRVAKTVQQVVSKLAEVVKSFATGNEPRPPTPPKEDPIKAEDDKPLEREKGKLHCGCLEDEVLLDLILWKSTLQQSPATGIVETWQDVYLHPRDRTFSLRAYTFWTGLKADHLYEFDADGKPRSMIDITRYQYRFFRNRLRRLKRAGKDLSSIISDLEELEMISFEDDEESDDEEEDGEGDSDDDDSEGDEDNGEGGNDDNEGDDDNGEGDNDDGKGDDKNDGDKDN
ncbi:hypothetical protein NP233_g5858 [Leucocoprinus birnbaumii]|uniref:Uncharacterized protein n=1 Tax=Leucocoprinus birnbaumii TaxID=56174 RepID=A0AAD5VUE0_9AGAR|nr:hypothetical protein NP233_g5858 [Leucocoprinus birnbaumii]